MSTCDLVLPTSTAFPDLGFAAAPRELTLSTVTYDLTIYELDHPDAAKAIKRRIAEYGCVCRVVKQHEFPGDSYNYLGGEMRFRATFIIHVPCTNEAEVMSRIRTWLESYPYSDSDLSPRCKPTATDRSSNYHN